MIAGAGSDDSQLASRLVQLELQTKVLPTNKRIAKEDDAARKREERGAQKAAERDQIIQALEASHRAEC